MRRPSQPAHQFGAKFEGLVRAQGCGLRVPHYVVLGSIDQVGGLTLPVMVRNSMRVPWDASDTVSGEGASYLCTSVEMVIAAFEEVRASSSQVAVLAQVAVEPVVSGVLHVLSSGSCSSASGFGPSVAGVSVSAFWSWTHGPSIAIVDGTADAVPHAFIADGPGTPTVVLPEQFLSDVQALPRGLVPAIRVAVSDVAQLARPVEVEWVWDGHELWSVQMQPLHVQSSSWPDMVWERSGG